VGAGHAIGLDCEDRLHLARLVRLEGHTERARATGRDRLLVAVVQAERGIQRGIDLRQVERAGSDVMDLNGGAVDQANRDIPEVDVDLAGVWSGGGCRRGAGGATELDLGYSAQ